jgi:hypothetical protein
MEVLNPALSAIEEPCTYGVHGTKAIIVSQMQVGPQLILGAWEKQKRYY